MLSRIAGALKDVLFPAKCLICGSFLYHASCRNKSSSDKRVPIENRADFSKLMTFLACKECLKGFRAVESPMCSHCGVMFKSREGEDHSCGQCLTFPKRFKTARSAGVYDRALMAAIHCLKYNGKIQLARPLGMLLYASFLRYWEKGRIDLIIPVPLHIDRMRMRGFNQVFLLVRDWSGIAEKLNLKPPQISVDRRTLVRKKWSGPQIGLSRKKRLANVKNVFGIRTSENITGKRILLVDDVYTTGATVNECAGVLMDGGASRVDVLTLAQAL